MISGFNTDVDCAGTVYHVQTEDNGAPHHVIMSLVYNKGTILASKRSPYEADTVEKELKQRVDKQHKLICAAVKAGRIDELKKMTAASRSAAKKPKAEPAVIAETVASIPLVASPPPSPPAAIIEPPEPEKVALDTTEVEIPLADLFDDVPIIDAVEIVEEYPEIIAVEAVEVVSELSGQARPTHQKLGIEILGDGRFRAGDRKTVNILICRGSDRKVVAGAQIMIKILGSSFRPVIFHARSDQNGLARVHLQVPNFNAGRAALLVRAIADSEEVELRRVVTPNT
ncbi:MAG: hypothetical protein JO314_01540 [Acidobacteria bacterium]|nr:hypothetical protein [Acidobacteriota bacterium]